MLNEEVDKFRQEKSELRIQTTKLASQVYCASSLLFLVLDKQKKDLFKILELVTFELLKKKT